MTRKWLFWVLAAALCSAANLMLIVINLDTPGPAGTSGPIVEWLSSSAYLATAMAGALILSGHPRHPIGWICGVGGTALVFAGLASEYPTAALLESGISLPAPRVVAWVGGWLWWGACGATLTFLFLLFPEGTLPSRRWRPVAWVLTANLAVLVLAHALAPGRLHGEYGVVTNPLGLGPSEGLLVDIRNIGWALLVANLVTALAALITRLVRASGDQRQQLKWLVYAGSIAVAALPVWAYARATGRHAPVLGQVLMGLAFVAIPLAAGIAILKYRLYEIDVVINKTLVFGALAGFITAVYAAVVVGVGAVVERVGDVPLSLVATAIVAIAFQPVRQRIQLVANHFVYGQHVSPYEAVTGFARRMSQTLAVDEVLPGIAEAAVQGVGGEYGGVEMFLPDGAVERATWPPDQRTGVVAHRVKVIHQGAVVGEITVGKSPVDPVTERDRTLLADLALQTGPVLWNVRLTRELQARLKDLQESRQRIVGAQDRERRRVERDIHDGAQQTLVSLSAKLGLARRLVRQDPAEAEALLHQVGEDLSQAVESLRDLARGIFPPLLTQRGLVPALEMHLLKAGVAADLSADLDDGTRFAPETEAALYFCAVEAVQNASKHARGADIAVHVACDGGWVHLTVTDDGPGFDTGQVAAGCGLQNMADRLAALGGQLAVISAPGEGTTVRGEVPVQPLPGLDEAMSDDNLGREFVT